jgi:alkaline phosphatase D
MRISRRTLLSAAIGVSGAAVLGACRDDRRGGPSTTEPSTTDPAGTEPPTSGPSPSGPATSTPSAPSTSEPATTAPAVTEAIDRGPFALGVASGDPDATSVVLWTRLVGDGLGDAVDIHWELATDEQFRDIVAGGTFTTQAADGLEPDTWYWYRFRSGEHTSATGRTRTMPDRAAVPARFTLGAASCQHFEAGYYAAHRDAADAGLDALVWLGDYIYEGTSSDADSGAVRLHGSDEPRDLDGYRARYALYRSDLHLQASHAACPWFVIWDDHEVDNNYAGVTSQDRGVDATAFRARRDAAYQAWWEHMPVRLPPPVAGDEYPIHRQAQIGRLAELTLLDGRQYRTDQACGDVTFSLAPACAETFDPERTMLGEAQETWFAEHIGAGEAFWNVVCNQVVMTDLRVAGAVLNYDQWDGYPAARARLLGAVARKAVPNLVVLTGDIHLAAVTDLRMPGADTNGDVIGTEFVTTSISSPANIDPATAGLLAFFPDIVGAELEHRGWTRHVITPDHWTAELRTVDDVTRDDSPVTVHATYRVIAGSPGAVREG